MSSPMAPVPVKLFAAVLYVDESVLQAARGRLQDKFGHIDYTSPSFPFAHEAYYAEEMGTPLRRIFYSFRPLIDPAALREVKLQTNALEQELAEGGMRRVNIDPGFVDYGKVVLASNKAHNQKIYLGDGVYADMNLLYEKGSFKKLDWTFPDFRSGEYDRVLLHIRAMYKAALRAAHRTESE